MPLFSSFRENNLKRNIILVKMFTRFIIITVLHFNRKRSAIDTGELKKQRCRFVFSNGNTSRPFLVGFWTSIVVSFVDDGRNENEEILKEKRKEKERFLLLRQRQRQFAFVNEKRGVLSIEFRLFVDDRPISFLRLVLLRVNETY